MIKRTYLMNRLEEHMKQLEKHFQIYYDCLDTLRKKVLAEEYRISKDIMQYEDRLKSVLQRA